MLEELFRPELRSLKPYQAATYEAGLVRLNANETPFPGVDGAGLNRYPPVRPETLTRRLAEHYQVAAESLLVTRGSSDAIELLIRATCRPGQDEILVLKMRGDVLPVLCEARVEKLVDGLYSSSFCAARSLE